MNTGEVSNSAGFDGRGPGREFDSRGRGPGGGRDDRSRSDSGGRVKSVQITTDSRSNTVFIAAPADKIAQAKAFIKEMDKPKKEGEQPIKIEPPETRTYAAPAGTAEVYAKTLQANNPGLSITAVPMSNNIVVFATPDEHDEIYQQINGRRKDGRLQISGQRHDEDVNEQQPSEQCENTSKRTAAGFDIEQRDGGDEDQQQTKS